MPLFEKSITINHQTISDIVKVNWGLQLGKILKASQNHTFEAKSEDNMTKYAVRVTPDPEHKHQQRIHDELKFIQYCTAKKLRHVCGPVKTKKQAQNLYICKQNLVVCVFQWAEGQQVDFFALTWMKNEQLIRAWGKYLAQLHQLSKQFEKQQPEIATRIQNWNQIHHGIMADVKLHVDDQKDVDNPKYYGVLHGDLNTSNFYYNKQADYLSVYDSDQVQRGFFEWDMAQGIFGCLMLQQCGLPISGKPVPQANYKQFMQMMVTGYEEVAGDNTVDQARLQRMVQLKKQFYLMFCSKAIEEGDIPKDMQPFIQFIVKSLGKQQK